MRSFFTDFYCNFVNSRNTTSSLAQYVDRELNIFCRPKYVFAVVSSQDSPKLFHCNLIGDNVAHPPPVGSPEIIVSPTLQRSVTLPRA